VKGLGGGFTVDPIIKTPTLRLVAAIAGFALAVGVVGCAPKPVTPVTVQVPTTAAPSVGPTSAPTASATGSVDAAGSAVGSTLTVGSASKGGKSSGIARPTDKAATAATVKELREDDQIGKVRSVSVRVMTQDNKGDWWVLVTIKDDMAGTNEVVMTYDGESWEYVVFGEGVTDEDLPPDVRF
jgi:hypothetical protein